MQGCLVKFLDCKAMSALDCGSNLNRLLWELVASKIQILFIYLATGSPY